MEEGTRGEVMRQDQVEGSEVKDEFESSYQKPPLMTKPGMNHQVNSASQIMLESKSRKNGITNIPFGKGKEEGSFVAAGSQKSDAVLLGQMQMQETNGLLKVWPLLLPSNRLEDQR